MSSLDAIYKLWPTSGFRVVGIDYHAIPGEGYFVIGDYPTLSAAEAARDANQPSVILDKDGALPGQGP